MPFEVQLTALPPELGLGLLVVFGVIAGGVNTIAGGGSLLALPILIILGIPPVMANGTIRVSVLAQNIAAVTTFARRRIIDPSLIVRFAPVMLAGAGCGAWGATQMSNDMMKPVVGAALAVWAVFLVLRPGSFLKPPDEARPLTVPLYLAAFGVGLYGGFLQAGVGFPLLALLVAGVGFDAVRANASKVALVGAYTLVSLPIFAFAGQVAWLEGFALAAGASVGAVIGARLQMKIGVGLVRWVVAIMVAISGIVMIADSLL